MKGLLYRRFIGALFQVYHLFEVDLIWFILFSFLVSGMLPHFLVILFHIFIHPSILSSIRHWENRVSSGSNLLIRMRLARVGPNVLDIPFIDWFGRVGGSRVDLLLLLLLIEGLRFIGKTHVMRMNLLVLFSRTVISAQSRIVLWLWGYASIGQVWVTKFMLEYLFISFLFYSFSRG